MELELINVLEDWGESWCMVCRKDKIKPIYRFIFQSKKTDIHGNRLIDTEISSCRKCCHKVHNNWKSYLDDLSEAVTLQKGVKSK